MALGDYDGDGDEDAAVIVHGGGIRLWRNDQTTGRPWLSVELKGDSSPLSGEGSLVTVITQQMRQTKLVGGNSSYLSGPTTQLLFGLGDATEADTVRIHWTSGAMSELTHIAANSRTVVQEGD